MGIKIIRPRLILFYKKIHCKLNEITVIFQKKYLNLLKQNIKLNDQNFKLNNNTKTIQI